MGFFSQVAEGFATGFIQAVAENGLPRGRRPALGGVLPGRIDRLCAELGWSIDGRDDDRVQLNFKDPVIGVRAVSIYSGDSDHVHVMANSAAIVQSVAPQLLEYLVNRHTQILYGAWSVTQINQGIGFILSYTAIGDGLSARVFQTLCGSMAEEAADFDGKMRGAGLLR